MTDINWAAWKEYDFAADWCAARGIKGDYGDRLPELISADAMALINEDQEAFQRRVNDMAYARAMSGRDQKATEALNKALRHAWKL